MKKRKIYSTFPDFSLDESQKKEKWHHSAFNKKIYRGALIGIGQLTMGGFKTTSRDFGPAIEEIRFYRC